MRRHSRLIALLVLLGVCLVQLQLKPITAQAQDIIPANAFLIRNKGDRPVVFFLRNGNGPWIQYSLSAEERALYYDKDQIWLAPEGQPPVHYTLVKGQRYRIIRQNSRWDVVRAEF
jgi:hypothetical protein